MQLYDGCERCGEEVQQDSDMVQIGGWHPYTCYCPNCGNLLLGYQDRNGTVKMTCKSCQASIVRRMMGRRHHRLDVYAPE